MPPTPDGLIKFVRDASFKNTYLHTTSGTVISAPQGGPDQAQHDVPKGLQAELSSVVEGIFGNEILGDWKFDSLRICWQVRVHFHQSLKV
jgi:hypothetical protein